MYSQRRLQCHHAAYDWSNKQIFTQKLKPVHLIIFIVFSLLLQAKSLYTLSWTIVFAIICCIYLNMTYVLRSKVKLFILLSHIPSISKKLWALENLPGFSSGLHGLQQEFPNFSQALNCSCLLSLHSISPSMPTTHSLPCIFTRVLGICNSFQKLSLKKAQEFLKCFLATWRIQAEGERKIFLIFPKTGILADGKNINEQIFIKPWKA